MAPPRVLSMEATLEAIHDLGRQGFPPAATSAFLRSSLLDPADLDRHARTSPARYTRNLVVRNDLFEVLVICWGRGHETPIHGHEGEKCWTRVERGRLRIENYRELDRDGARAQLEHLSTIEGAAGFVDGPADIHAVLNPRAFDGPAVSFHLYSRPYDACDVYDPATGLVSRRPLAFDSVEGRPLLPDVT